MRDLITTALELIGIGLLVTFAWFCWPPAAFGVGGASALVVSWRLTPRAPKPPKVST